MDNVLYIEGSGDMKGGGQISLLKLLEKIDRKKVHPVLLCPFEGALTSRVERLGIEVKIVRLGSLKGNPFAFPASVADLRKIMKEMKADIVHANTSRSVLYGGLAAKPLGIPVIWHVRVIESEGLYDRFLVSLCTSLIAVSMAVRERFSWLFKRAPDKVRVIYNGVDLKEFHSGISGDGVRRELHLSPETPVAGVVGNLIPWKGQTYFIRAAARVIKSVPSARFLVVGDGECRKDLEESAERLGLKNEVIFLGKRSDIPQIMAAADVLVHSSISPEPFARVIIEGMAMGKPIVAMNEGGVPEIITDGVSGFLIPPKEDSLMAREIVGLFSDRRKAGEIGLRARRTVEERFSIEKNVAGVEALYAGILRGKEYEDRN